MGIRPSQVPDALKHFDGAINGTRAEIGAAGMAGLAAYVNIDIGSPPVAQRQTQIGIAVDDAELRLFIQRVDNGIRAVMAAVTLVVDRPVQPSVWLNARLIHRLQYRQHDRLMRLARTHALTKYRRLVHAVITGRSHFAGKRLVHAVMM